VGSVEDSAQYRTHRFSVFVDAPDRAAALQALGRALADNNNMVPLDDTRHMIGMMINPQERAAIPDGMRKP
jgi:hypothetical protein